MSTLSADELDDLLRRPILGRLATIRPDGWPAIVPVWIEWDGRDAWVIARATSGYVADVRADPRVCLSVVDDDDPDRRAQLFCRADIARDTGPLEGETMALARRMASRYEGEAGLRYIESSAAWPRVLLRLEPDRIVTWASPEWHHRYRSGDDAGARPDLSADASPAEEPRP